MGNESIIIDGTNNIDNLVLNAGHGTVNTGNALSPKIGRSGGGVSSDVIKVKHGAFFEINGGINSSFAFDKITFEVGENQYLVYFQLGEYVGHSHGTKETLQSALYAGVIDNATKKFVSAVRVNDINIDASGTNLGFQEKVAIQDIMNNMIYGSNSAKPTLLHSVFSPAATDDASKIDTLIAIGEVRSAIPSKALPAEGEPSPPLLSKQPKAPALP